MGIQKELPEYVSSGEGTSLFPTLGSVLRISQVFDVVFLYANGCLVQYQGILMGWRLFKSEPMSEQEAKEYVIKWFE